MKMKMKMKTKMKNSLIFLSLIIVVICTDPIFQLIRRTANDSFIALNNTGYCSRTAEITGAEQWRIINLLAVCSPGSSTIFDRVELSIFNNNTPLFGIRTFNKSTDTVEQFEAYLIIDELFEYIEKDGIQGYSPTGDIKSTSWPLSNESYSIWSNITMTVSNIHGADSNEKVYTFIFNTSNIMFIIDIPTQPATYGVSVLTPDSFKITIILDGYVYQNTIATGLVLNAAIITQKTVSRSNDISNSIVNLGDPDTDTSSGFLGWDVEAFAGTGDSLVGVYSSQLVPDNAFNNSQFDIEGNAQRIYFSFNERVNAFEWDSTLGVLDYRPSSSFMVLPSLSTILLLLFLSKLLV